MQVAIMRILNSELVFIGFGILPIVTYFDVTTASFPPPLFYGIWFICSIWLGILVILNVRFNKAQAAVMPMFALFSMVFSLSIITPLSVPFNVIDNFPSTPQTVQLTQLVLSAGKLPTNLPAGLSYANYPACIFVLASLQSLTGLSFVVLTKILGVVLSIIPTFGFYALIKNKSIALPAAAIAGLSPWIFNHVTHYTAPGVAAVLISLNIAMLFRLMEEGSTANLSILFILTVVLTFSDVLISFLWIIFLAGTVVLASILRGKDNDLRFSILSLLFLAGVLWFVWYIVFMSSDGLISFFQSVGNQIFFGFKTNTSVIQPSGSKPSSFTDIEYAAFLALFLYSVASFFYFGRKRPFYSSMLVGAFVAAVAVVVPWIAGFETGTDLVTRSILIFQMGVAPVLAALLFEQSKSSRIWPAIFGVVLISLIASNALLYGVEPYRYDSSSPFVTAQDTRLDLEGWHYGSATFCQYTQTKEVWGVIMGSSFFQCLTEYNQLVPGVSNGPPIVPASSLLDLQSVIGAGQFVVLRQSIAQVPEWPEKLPASPNTIFSHYDVVLQSGDVVILYT
jgi:hypothetical protein